MAIVSGSTYNTDHAGPCKIKSVTVNASVDGDGVSIYDFNDITGNAKLVVTALADLTNQAHFQGVDFLGGFVVVPDTNVTFYLIEYEPV